MTEPSRGLRRVLDVNRNRALEALRVLEDHARFQLSDPRLAAAGKALRHDLRRAFEAAALTDLSVARDARGDVGAPGQAAHGEAARGDLSDVLRANASRAKEALRSLEEYGRLLSGDLANALEALRYRIYDYEKALCDPRREARARLRDEPLTLLLSPGPGRPPLTEQLARAEDGGCRVFQLRLKDAPDREVLRAIEALAPRCEATGSILIVNDRADLAASVPGLGVHLGQGDAPPALARKVLGDGALIGVSVHSVEEREATVTAEVDYIGLGTVYASPTKPELGSGGPALVASITAGLDLPSFAIGGVTAANAGAAIAAGASGVAVSAAILDAPDISAATRALIAAVRRARAETSEGAP